MTETTGAPPLSRTAYVAERLKADVASGAIKPGELIKQTVLAKRYGVSATPVREAMRLLEADGVIDYSPHRGATVREMTPETARDLYRLRAAVERVAAEMAGTRMTPSGLEAIRRAHGDIARALADPETTPSELSVLNRRFHFEIYALTSPLIVQHVELLWARFTPGTTVWRAPEDAAALQADHDLILAALEQGDSEAAGRHTAEHIARAARIRERQPDIRAAGQDERLDIGDVGHRPS
ncbi:GntR family transcriptional regulator [Nocardia otitidiscaviarum]|uniref:GntR family transcriptional regulator n=1 Tax=Nocardia otitidiscaviarum TaxID=1823 RepID=UPI001895BD61|nr:GntR family transcriptional regulator [Nocardia otitidiscaviarum]MBF6180804.1 GntR family transcriptional regulator [Nocardia otitidiscaviarum]